MTSGMQREIRVLLRCALLGALVSTGVWGSDLPSTRDTLVYKDGDRIHGTVVSRTAEEIVFKSERFGELRVRAADAVVIRADEPVVAQAAKPAPTAAKPAAEKPAAPPSSRPTASPERREALAAAERAEEERVTLWDRFSPAVLTARVRNYFGPWRGRLSFSTEVVSDVAKRNNSSYEGRLSRKWKSDELQVTARFDYSETNNVTTTDIVKLSGQWRHEFNKQLFGHYRPSSEWNRASKLRGVPNDYVLLQQELGMGYHVLTTPGRKVRAGVSQNLFDTWNLTPPRESHFSRGVVSAFEESEFTLPWRISISQRGVWYPVANQRDGWENRFEVNKKLTETLSTSLRHEIRRHNPDGTAQDFDRLKLLFAMDF